MERYESNKDLVECCDHPLHDVSGDVIIRDRLTVCGNLRAHKVDPAERGLFLTVESLKESCTVCRKGDWALVGKKSPFDVYRWDNGWYKTDATYDVEVPVEDYLNAFETKLKVLGENAGEIVWDDTCNMNNYKTAGTYRIKGERTNKADNLPIGNANPGHTIDGVLYVLNSSLPNGGVSEDDKCVTQFLMLSNRVGGQEGDMYMRSGYGLHTSDDAFTWKPWEKFQTNIEVGAVSDDATHDPSNFAPINANGLNSLVDNGIYSGVYLTEEALSGDSTKAQTFVMVVINNYAAAGDYKTVTQIKFAVTNAGEYSMERRSRGFDEKWSGWVNEYNDLSTRMDEAESRIGAAEGNIELNTAQIDELKERSLAEIPTFTGVVDSTDNVFDQTTTQFLGVYYIKSRNVFAALNGDNYYTDWQAQGMFQSSKCYNQNGVAVENRIYYLKDMFDTGKAPSLLLLKGGSFVEVNDNADVEEAITSLQERAVNHEDTLTTHGKQIAALQNKGQNMEYDIEQQQGILNSQGTRLTEVEHRADEHDTQIAQINTDMKQMDDNILRHGEGIENLQKEVATKQQELTLTVLDNGNIRIGNLQGQTKDFMPATPSGDPMHYAYIEAGAVWNGSTGFWEYCGLTDLTTDDVRKSYNIWVKVVTTYMYAYEKVRFTFPVYDRSNGDKSTNYYYAMRQLEVVPPPIPQGVWLGVASSAFYSCEKLRQIGGTFDNIERYGYAFNACPMLVEIRVDRLCAPISVKDSPLISKESIKSMIDGSNATTAITITLHHEAYARLANDADIVAALEAKNAALAASGGSISLVSA